jgi:hypothetical protein
MTNTVERLAADVQPEEYELMRPAVSAGRSVEVCGRTGVLSFEEIKVGFGTLYRVTVTLGAGTAVPADDTCRDVIAMLDEAGRLVPAMDLDLEAVLETPPPAFV